MPLIFCTKPLFPDGFELTTCNAFGPFGPLQEDCNKEYLVNLSFSLSQSRKYSLSHSQGLAKQCDQVGRFLEVQGRNICYKSSPNIKCLLGLFRHMTLFREKLLCLLFGHILAEFLSNVWSHCGHERGPILSLTLHASFTLSNKSIQHSKYIFYFFTYC